MYVLFLTGGTASGKSTAARELERLGAVRLDLDQLSREVLAPGGPCVGSVAAAFGEDLLDPASGSLDRRLLAQRAFENAGQARLLEGIELPHIKGLLLRRLRELEGRSVAVCVVEVPLLDRVEDLRGLADELVWVRAAPLLRRQRALGRGMDARDYERRLAGQPSDAYLEAHADTVIPNDGDAEELLFRLRSWWDEREGQGWQKRGGVTL